MINDWWDDGDEEFFEELDNSGSQWFALGDAGD